MAFFFPSSASSKWNITIWDSTRQNSRSYLRRIPVSPSLGLLFNIFNCIFCPVQLQMVIIDFREKGTGTEHVAIATSKYVRSGMFEWMNEWMNVYLYTAHIRYCLKAVYNANWVRSNVSLSACKGGSSCRYRFIFDLTRPPNPCMKCTMKLQIDHNTGNYVPYSFRQVCGFFNVACWPCNTEDAGDGAGDGAYGL